MAPTELADYGPNGGRALWWLNYTEDPRVVAVVLARYENHYVKVPRIFRDRLGLFGITATPEQALALLDAVAKWDEQARVRGDGRANRDVAEALTAAVTAIVEERA